jgi:hypothetical protein
MRHPIHLPNYMGCLVESTLHSKANNEGRVGKQIELYTIINCPCMETRLIQHLI